MSKETTWIVKFTIKDIEETKNLGTFERFIEDCGLEEIHADVLSARKELVGFTPIELAV